MNGGVLWLFAEHLDQPLDLPPAAIVNDIPEIAASAGARRRLVRREAAELLDELGRLGGRGGVGNVNVKVQNATAPER